MVGLSPRMRRIGASWVFGIIAFIAFAVLMAILEVHADCGGTSVRNLSLQLAWDVTKARDVVKLWNHAGCSSQAASQVWLDYLFIPAYVSFLFFVGLRSQQAAERRGMSTLAVIAGLSAWGALLAGLFDCLENVGLLVMILKGQASIICPLVLLTSLVSTLKWLLIVASGFVGLTVLVRVIVHCWKQHESALMTAR